MKCFCVNRKILYGVLTSLFLAFVFLYNFAPLETEDIWWHLATGKWIVQHGQVPHGDLFPFTNESPTAWNYLHSTGQWLGSTIFYLIYQWGGGEGGLKIFRALFFTGIIGLFLAFGRKRLPFPLLLLLGYWLTISLGTRLLLRPLIFNFLFIQIFLIVLLRYQTAGRFRTLLWIPLCGIIWSNIHLGALAYGMTLIGIFLLNSVVAYFNKRAAPEDESRLPDTRQIRHLSAILFLYLLSFLINPYGSEAFLYHFKIFLIPSYINFYKLSAVIKELQPPTYIVTGEAGLWLVAVFFLSLGAILRNKTNSFLYLLLCLVPFFMFLRSQRSIDLFAVSVCYVVAGCATHLNWKAKWALWKNSKFINLAVGFFMVWSTGIFCLRSFQSQVFIDNRAQPRWLQTTDTSNPKAILDTLRAAHITGEIFNNDYLGGAIIWNGYPTFKPFTDSRQINQKLFFLHHDIHKDPVRVWPYLERTYPIKIVILDANFPFVHRLITHLNEQPAWQLIMIKGAALVFVKRGVFDLPPTLANFETEIKNTPLRPGNLAKLKEFEKKSAPDFPNPFRKHLTYIEPLEEGANLMGLGLYGAGVQRLIQATQISQDKMVLDVVASALKILENRSTNSPAQKSGQHSN